MACPIEGGCLCGSIRYRIVAEPVVSTICHCRSCRRASAAALVPWIHLDSAHLEFTAGEPARYESSPGVTRSFCGRCGTPLTYRKADYGPMIDVTTCSLDNPEAFPPMAHLWMSDALGWLRLADDAVRFDEGPPAN